MHEFTFDSPSIFSFLSQYSQDIKSAIYSFGVIYALEILNDDEKRSVFPLLSESVGQDVSMHCIDLYHYNYEKFYFKCD